MAWITALVFIIVGIVIGFVFARLTAHRHPHQQDVEKELEKSRYELEQYRQELMDHFDQSAELLENISKDYNKLYQHMAKTSAELIPNLPEQDTSFARRLTKISHLIETVPTTQKSHTTEKSQADKTQLDSANTPDCCAPKTPLDRDANAQNELSSAPSAAQAPIDAQPHEIIQTKNAEIKTKKIEKEHEDEAVLTP